jgi:hypothetical protein
VRTRERWLVVLAVAVGAAIAFVDSRPGWDDTGITAGLLLGSAAVVAAASGRRPWLWALLIGLPTPVFEMATGGSPGSIAALGLAAVGSLGGWFVARSTQVAEGDRTPRS